MQPLAIPIACIGCAAGGGDVERADDDAIDLARLGEHAAERHARHINPVLIGIGGPASRD